MHDGSASRTLLDQVQILFTAGTSVGLTDRDLLERFLNEGHESGEAAFNALVERHGRMVLRVCNQALRDRHAAEDAFQATFLVLARQARSIRKHDSVGSWLFGVACRAAARIRMAEGRRQRYERRGAKVPAPDHTDALDSSEHWPELHAEIARLPEKYRIPIVLCYFEGLTHEQAADRLGWPVGTVKTRLARARDQLRWRLERRDWSPAPWFPTEPLRPSDIAEVPRLLLGSTTRAAAELVSRAGNGAFTSSGVLAITHGVLKAMLIHKLRLAAIALLGVMALGLGAMVLARQAPGGRPVDGQSGPVSVPAKDDPQPKVLRLFATTDYIPSTVMIVRTLFDNCRVEEVLVDLGATVKRGDPLLKLFSTDLAAAKSEYEMACSQWKHDKKVYDYKVPLAKENTIAKKELIDVEDNEAQSRLKMKIAKDKLLWYGLSEEEIANAPNEDGVEKGKMIVRSRGEGVVVKKTVVKGNFYDSKDELMVITPLDRLYVRGNISEVDADKVQVGQTVKVIFPLSDSKRGVVAKIDYIDKAIDPNTRSAKFRTTIPNPEGRLKAGAFVRVDVDLGPTAKSSRVTNAPPERKSNPSLDERLSEVERKLNRLLDENDRRDPNARILERLNELERKLDRVLDLKAPDLAPSR
jgi:RNA polymerase sigma factor (sigma-70 family)